MRKITGVLIGITLLLIAGPASAAINNGTGDPLSLISGAVIQPFWNQANDSTLIEVTSPVDDNGLVLEGIVVTGDAKLPLYEFERSFLHVVYYNATCLRIISVPHRISYKGATVFSPDIDLGTLGPMAGLAVITKSSNGQIAEPIPNFRAIHVRGHWYNFIDDFVHEVDPIAGSSPQSPGPQTYSPLRSAASFGAPIEGGQGGVFHTTIYLVCPTSTVFPSGPGFPLVNFTPGPHTLLGYLYDARERKIIDYTVFCSCLTMFDLETLPLYGNPFQLPDGLSYTELVSYEPATGPIIDATDPEAIEVATLPPGPEATNPRAFVAYRQILVDAGIWPGGSGDDFGRTNNGSAYNYRVNLSDPFVPNPQRFVPGLR
jgi:hypothetical protein